MKQILQNLGSGATEVAEVPCPQARAGHLLIRTSRTLVSAGTERMLVEFGRGNLIQKAKSQPDKVKDVLSKIKTDGLMPTLDAVKAKLDVPMPLGYCNAGTVLEVGRGVEGFAVGDRVVSNGNHAEVVAVPKNLCARIPEGVTDEEAAFTVLASIGLQGIRLLRPTLGECFVVSGLGLIGLMCVQMLRAAGCRVLGLDFNAKRLEIAKSYGAETVNLGAGEDPVEAAMGFSRGKGVDGVLICAATDSNEPIKQSAHMCRKRGRIVLVGVVGLQLSRADFYEKELTFQVSCSYGPGRYDPTYEQGGQDYPMPFVRWTEQRNFEAVLDMMASGALNVRDLITHRYAIEHAPDAYNVLTGDKAAMGILLEYPTAEAKPADVLRSPTVNVAPGEKTAPATGAGPTVSFIGSGNYAGRFLIPAFQKGGAKFGMVASSGGVTAQHFAKKYGFRTATTDTDALIADGSANAVAIVTRHDTHARFSVQALKAGKSVFVEKPLALTQDELDAISTAHEASKGIVMVGFNRRFAPHIVKMKQLLGGIKEPKSFIYTVNAGAIPPDHWIQDLKIGGGRIIGEGCHFVDLIRFLAGSPLSKWEARMMGETPLVALRADKASLHLEFADGSTGTVHYLANGHKSFPKERLEVFVGGRVLQMDNFRVLTGYGWPGFTKLKLWSQNKGQVECATAFVNALSQGKPSPIPYEEIVEVHRACIEMQQSLVE